MWAWNGQIRPSFADEPEPGQESVWDYPRPPVIEPDARMITVRFQDLLIAQSARTLKILETASAPGFYLPADDVEMHWLRQAAGGSFCEWKGSAVYFDFHAGSSSIPRCAWSYPEPTPEFSPIAGYIAFYPALVECYIDDERVRPQPGGFYGGWLTSDIAGPVKGAPGTHGW